MQQNRTRNSQQFPDTTVHEKKRSSKLFSFFKLFQTNNNSSNSGRSNERNSQLFPEPSLDRSSSKSFDSIHSNNTFISTGTIASFIFLNPATYRCFRKKPITAPTPASVPDRLPPLQKKKIVVRPELKKCKLKRCSSDSNLNKVEKDRGDGFGARRTASMPQLCFSNVKAVRRKIKRKAPQPPQPPQPLQPAAKPIESELNCKLNSRANQDNHLKPWYKRSSAVSESLKRKSNRLLPKINFNGAKNDSLKMQKNRKSGITFLTNISSLDSEANEILRNEPIVESSSFAKMVKVKYLQQSQLVGWTNSIKKRRIEKETRTKNTVLATKPKTIERKINWPIIEKKPKVNEKWQCTKCLKENDYWRILCYFCNHIKPFGEKVKVAEKERKSLKKKSSATKNRIVAESKNSLTFENSCTLRIDDVCGKKTGTETVRTATKPDPDCDYEIVNDKNKTDQETLKKMLIEMKNSLPKKTKTNARSVSLPYENIKPLPIDAKITANGDDSFAKNIKLISSKRFEEMEQQRLELLQIYSDLRDDKANLNISTLRKLCTNVPKHLLVGTVEINKLLRNLEITIAGGKMDRAAEIAKELAVLQVRCSVTRQNIGHVYQEIRINFFVEDGVTQKGPFTLYVDKNWSLSRLKEATHLVFNYPSNTQKWIINNQLAKQNDYSLIKLGAFQNDEPFFLYLVDPDDSSDNKNVDNSEPKKITNPNIWICKVCTHENPLDFSNCLACFEKNDEPLAAKKLTFNPMEVWECSSCTLINSNELLNCFACMEMKNGKKSKRSKPVVQGIPTEPEIIYDSKQFWKCTKCTFLNVHAMKNCLTCLTSNPENTKNDYFDLIELDEKNLIGNSEPFECLICFETIEKLKGVVLRDCFHQFCAECLRELINSNENAIVQCPFIDKNVSCPSLLQEREIKSLLSEEEYRKHLQRSLNEAEAKLPNSFHCKTADCIGWCEFEDLVNHFECPICKEVNCLTCNAIHKGYNCKQYQDLLIIRAANDKSAKMSLDALNEMLNSRVAMRCPTCKIIIVKNSGCDGMLCTMCKTEICWATRGPRWGPRGKNDTSGGCRCNVNGRPCHPNCQNCH